MLLPCRICFLSLFLSFFLVSCFYFKIITSFPIFHKEHSLHLLLHCKKKIYGIYKSFQVLENSIYIIFIFKLYFGIVKRFF